MSALLNPNPTFSISVEIDAPVERVWEVMSDVERWPEWTPSVSAIRRLSRGPFAVGSLILVRQPKFPPAVWRVTNIEPNRSFTWITGSPGMRVMANHGVQSIDGRSRATLSLDYRGWMGRLLARWTRSITERYLSYEAEGLKRRSEDRDGP